MKQSEVLLTALRVKDEALADMGRLDAKSMR
jgi:hypothetical protein